MQVLFDHVSGLQVDGGAPHSLVVLVVLVPLSLLPPVVSYLCASLLSTPLAFLFLSSF